MNPDIYADVKGATVAPCQPRRVFCRFKERTFTYTMLPTRKSVPRSSRQLDHTKTIVKRRKLQWYGHVSRSLGLAKTILQGTVKGGRRQGRQRKRWEDNIREWTGQEFGKSRKAVENREKWRKLVAKSYVLPQRPS